MTAERNKLPFNAWELVLIERALRQFATDHLDNDAYRHAINLADRIQKSDPRRKASS